jgi:hypothetical protein
MVVVEGDVISIHPRFADLFANPPVSADETRKPLFHGADF